MAITVADALRALEEATELARTIKIELDDEYMRLIAIAEARPENAEGADKSWVAIADEAFRRHYRSARPV